MMGRYGSSRCSPRPLPRSLRRASSSWKALHRQDDAVYDQDDGAVRKSAAPTTPRAAAPIGPTRSERRGF
jgi:hypothetical protein